MEECPHRRTTTSGPVYPTSNRAVQPPLISEERRAHAVTAAGVGASVLTGGAEGGGLAWLRTTELRRDVEVVVPAQHHLSERQEVLRQHRRHDALC